MNHPGSVASFPLTVEKTRMGSISGSHAITVTGQRALGGGSPNISATAPDIVFVAVEDLGP